MIFKPYIIESPYIENTDDNNVIDIFTRKPYVLPEDISWPQKIRSRVLERVERCIWYIHEKRRPEIERRLELIEGVVMKFWLDMSKYSRLNHLLSKELEKILLEWNPDKRDILLWDYIDAYFEYKIRRGYLCKLSWKTA